MFAKNLRLRVSKAKANDVSTGFHANFHIWPLKFVEGISHGEICARRKKLFRERKDELSKCQLTVRLVCN